MGKNRKVKIESKYVRGEQPVYRGIWVKIRKENYGFVLTNFKKKRTL